MTDTTTAEREPVDIALDAIPGFRAIQDAENVLQQRTTALRTGASVPQVDLVAEAFEALLAGKPLPEDLGRRAWEVTQAHEFREDEMNILAGVEKRLTNHGENTLRAGADHGLRALRPVLDELLGRARPMVEALRGVHDAQGAIDRGPDAVAAWSGFGAIVSRYAAIRSAQHKITRITMGQDVGTRFGSVGFNSVFRVWSEIENVAEVWPEWLSAQNGERAVRPPWPVRYPNRPFEVQHDREWVMWLLSNPKVRLWVPTIGELTEAWVAQRESTAEREDGTPKPKTGEPRRRPVRTRDAEGGLHTEYVKIED
ncbi:hypothetical protein ACH5AI_00710 [Streptomyces collinus]|uniref:hypothetical protein n=1 Tax=Streptomyces collinus TaxID=42684 RepID=UPI0037AA61E2